MDDALKLVETVLAAQQWRENDLPNMTAQSRSCHWVILRRAADTASAGNVAPYRDAGSCCWQGAASMSRSA
jgi:hypothetical protein